MYSTPYPPTLTSVLRGCVRERLCEGIGKTRRKDESRTDRAFGHLYA